MDIFRDEIKNVVHVIKGECHGVVMSKRGYIRGDNNHVIVTPIVEDDENWFISKSGGFSSYWLPKYIKVMEQAQKWIEDNCDPDMPLIDGNPTEFGWKFRG